MNMYKYNCKVCGLYNENPPWGEDGNTPTYEICSCCGVEFGNEDYTLESIKKYREIWVNKGSVWFESSEKPTLWNLEEQLKKAMF